jgi:hypothetical protein
MLAIKILQQNNTNELLFIPLSVLMPLLMPLQAYMMEFIPPKLAQHLFFSDIYLPCGYYILLPFM